MQSLDDLQNILGCLEYVETSKQIRELIEISIKRIDRDLRQLQNLNPSCQICHECECKGTGKITSCGYTGGGFVEINCTGCKKGLLDEMSQLRERLLERDANL